MKANYLEVGLGIGEGSDSFQVGLEAAQQAFSQINLYKPKVVLVYASTNYDLPKVLEGIVKITGDIPLLGTSTGGEISSLSSDSNSVVVVIMASPYLRVNIGIGENLEEHCEEAIEEAFQQARISEYFSHQSLSGELKVSYLNPYKSIFAFAFFAGKVDGYNAKGFEITNLLRKKLGTKLPIFGGGSSTHNDSTPTYQLANGKIYTDSLVLALFETDLKFGIGKAHGFIPTEKHIVVTRAKDYVIEELNYRPAAEVLAAMYNISLKELKDNALKYFYPRPFGIRDIYGSYSLIHAYRITEDNGIELHMQVQENTLLTIMESNVERIIKSEQKAINKARLHGELRNPAVVFLHSCMVRKESLGNQQETCLRLITEAMQESRLAGFYSSGEHGVSEEGVPLYFNGTAVALAIGNELNPVSAIALNNISLYEEITALYQVSTALNSTLQLEEILNKTVGLIKEVMKVEEASLFLLEEGNGDLSLQASTSNKSEQDSLDLLKEVCNLVLQKKSFVITQQEGQVRSILAVPITSKEKITGVVAVTSRNDGYFSKRETEFLLALASQAGMAIENARLYRMMEYSASTDGLTGLYNHRYFQVRLQEEVIRAERNRSNLSLLMLDIDYFKHYNDHNGHPQGDEVLKTVAQILASNVRSIDVVSRYGGEEFAIILPETAGENAISVAERIRKNVEENFFLGSRNQPTGQLTVSMGIATYPFDANNKEDLIRRADQALYQAKYQGRNTVHLYRQSWI